MEIIPLNFKNIYSKLLFFYINIIIIINIRTQELNNIFNIGKKDYLYVNFASYSNGDMILETTTGNQNDNNRLFYGFKSNGRGYFKNEINYSIDINQPTSPKREKYQSENIVIKEANNKINNKEYLISIPKEITYVEIYDFENNKVFQKRIETFTGLDKITSFRHSSISLRYNNSFCYLFGFIGKNNSSSDYSYILQIHKFNSIKDFELDNTKIKEKIIKNIIPFIESSGISCFSTEKQNIMCFFYSKVNNFTISIYDINLNELDKLSFRVVYKDNIDNPFYKCIHLKEEVGIFSYFVDLDSTNYYLNLLLKEFSSNIKNYSISEIPLNFKTLPSKYLTLNDIIKMNKNKICFCSIKKNGQALYIILINLYSVTFKIRYYFIEMFYSYQFYLNLQIHNYNNKFIAFAFAYNNNPSKCLGNMHNVCNAFLIFNYPNSDDKKLNLNDYIYNYRFDNNVNINLKNEIRIENNIFGYIFKGILINELINCNNLDFFSSKTNNKILPNYTLEENESINLNLSIGIYNGFNCILEYRAISTEPDLNTYDSYATTVLGEDDNLNFQKDDYFGKLTYYNISLSENITTSCDDENCALCLKERTDFCIFCKYNFTFVEGKKNCSENNFEGYISVEMINYKEIYKINMNITKQNLADYLPYILENIKREKIYEISDKDFDLKIKPSNESFPNSTNVDFLPCENILREHYNISDSRIITFLQMELKNKDENSLINNIGYQVYDDQNTILDLSLCNDTNIQIFYLIKSNSSLNISFVSNFKDLNIDIFNINDLFFQDICFPYSDSENDVILYDRVLDFYQNYSLCQEGCTYKKSDLNLMIITCDCKVKNDLNPNENYSSLVQIEDIEKSSPFEIIKCYNLVFSMKNKNNNIGFWIFLIFVILQSLLLFIHLYKGITLIKEYLSKEMREYGYIDNKERIIKRNKKSSSKINKIKSPPKNKRKKIINNDETSANRIKLFDNNKNNLMKLNVNNNVNNINIQNLNILSVKKNHKIKSKKKAKKKKISLLTTQGGKNQKEKISNNENSYINLNLININLKNRKLVKKIDSNHILNAYNFKDAIKYDFRSIARIFYILLLTKFASFHAFLYKSPLEGFQLRCSLLVFILSSDLALNAILYFDDKISEKYRYAKSIFLFAFSNNLTVILLSTLFGFIIIPLFIKLTNCSNDIRNIFRKEEEKIRKNKKYIVNKKRKQEIHKEINDILRKYKIKTFIVLFVELILMIFFWYYVTAFCHVYNSTQMSWIWDSFLSILSRITIYLLLCLGIAKLYRLAVESNILCLYKLSLFFYCFRLE